MKKLKLNKLILFLYIIIAYFTQGCKKKSEKITKVEIENWAKNINIKIFFFKDGVQSLKYELNYLESASEDLPGECSFDFFHSQADSIKVLYTQ